MLGWVRLVKTPISRNPCVIAPFRCQGRNSAQAVGAFADELPRAAFGVRPACWRCRKARVVRKQEQTPRSPNVSRSSIASLQLCAFAVGLQPRLCHRCNQWPKLLLLESVQYTPAMRILLAGHSLGRPLRILLRLRRENRMSLV